MFEFCPVSTIDGINSLNCVSVRVETFQQLARSTDNCLRYLLPDMRDSIITNRLRSANKFPLIFAKTIKFKNSFICYRLPHYQLRDTHIFVCNYLQCTILYCTNPTSVLDSPSRLFQLLYNSIKISENIVYIIYNITVTSLYI